MKNLFVSTSLVAAALFALPAQAVTVTFDYTNTNLGGDNSGKTSPLLGANNAPIPGSVFVETFSAINGGGNAQGCGLDTPAGLITITGGTYGFRKNTLSGVAAAPAGDSTCFAYGPGAGQTSSTVNIDYTGLLSGLGANASLNYLGLYYGSIDTYNDLIFYNAAHQVIRTVTGTELIAQFAGQSGNQNADSSNIYVNLFFSPSE
ncbi:MAG: hypothetical protein JWP29_5265, partial [Rhodoferax sp.]|nr:hypothetical protein [Rhodoferax sp.]